MLRNNLQITFRNIHNRELLPTIILEILLGLHQINLLRLGCTTVGKTILYQLNCDGLNDWIDPLIIFSTVDLEPNSRLRS